MKARKTNRREFLGLTGASLVGLAMTAGALSLPGSLAAPVVAAERKPPIEEWLLGTGQPSLSPGIYNNALEVITRNQQTGGKSKTSKGGRSRK
ncbi:MAG TPA: hypothetical protein VGB76_07555 [Pyrinomonadaceae bacterium]|jgi:hypothetical protein